VTAVHLITIMIPNDILTAIILATTVVGDSPISIITHRKGKLLLISL
jgi:hypothetical protein